MLFFSLDAASSDFNPIGDFPNLAAALREARKSPGNVFTIPLSMLKLWQDVVRMNGSPHAYFGMQTDTMELLYLGEFGNLVEAQGYVAFSNLKESTAWISNAQQVQQWLVADLPPPVEPETETLFTD